jgi:hypothetical protein
MYLIGPRLAELVAAGRKWSSKAACASELHEWFGSEHPGLPVPTAKTILNNYRSKMLTSPHRVVQAEC